MKSKTCYAIKHTKGSYYIGMGRFGELRRAKLYRSLKCAEEIVERFPDYNCKIVRVTITEEEQT